MTDAGICFRFDELTELITGIFRVHGTSDAVARILAHNMVSAERDGGTSHGLFRLPGYLSTLASGWVDGHALPIIEDAGAAFVAVDAANGFAQPALALAAPLAVNKARATGAAVIAIRHSHHFGALSLDVEPFAEQGLVALALVNSMAVVIPPGGTAPVYGTNPMAFAAPRKDGGVLLFDQAVSTMAHGDVQIAAREGRSLPDGTGVDRHGQPTNDPADILDGGGLIPFGGHKGASIALMIEVMAAALTGGAFSFEVDWSAHPGAMTPCTGQCLILIDPARTGTLERFTARMEALLAAVGDAGQARLPGEGRLAARAAADRNGIMVPAETAEYLSKLAAEPAVQPLG